MNVTLILNYIHSGCIRNFPFGNFHKAYKKEFFTTRNPRTKRIQHISLQGDKLNNKMQRLNDEVRDTEKGIMGLKKGETPILRGYQIFHNYFRIHKGLENRTPAEVSGIKIEGQNKWIILIQIAIQSVQ